MKAKKQKFGVLCDGTKVNLFTFSNDKMSVSCTEYGASLTSIVLEKNKNKKIDVLFGFSTFEGYINSNACYGSIVGRFANRIGNASFSVNGEKYNLEAIEFLKCLNKEMFNKYGNILMIAEESTSFPKITHPVEDGGLGFDYKWDLGWMNDTLKYFKEDPVYRSNLSIHHKLTFSMMYYYSERFILPFSHDEVVHGKGTILDKMWGNNDQKFAQYKALHLYMMTHPGKKLNFMGNELAEYKEWDEKTSLGWNLLDYPQHEGFFKFYNELNHIIKDHPAFYELDYNQEGFEWLVVDDNSQSVFAYARKDKEENVYVCVMNFIGNSHYGYQIPVPTSGTYKEIMNTDSYYYCGSNHLNTDEINSKEMKVLNKENVIEVNIAPFSAMIFELQK